MTEFIEVLQLSVFTPILVVLFYRIQLSGFYKILFATLLLSLIFDGIGSIAARYGSNIKIYSIYILLHTILFTYLWTCIPFYSSRIKKYILILGVIFLSCIIGVFYCCGFNNNGFYPASILNVLLIISLSLVYYYHKITTINNVALEKDSYFIVASGLLIFGISTIVILGGEHLFDDGENLPYTWFLRQLFYSLYNVIIAYAFYNLKRNKKV